MDSSRVTNKTLFVLAQLSAQLKHLTLARCASVSDTGVIAVAEGTPVLRSLDLTSVERISDQVRYFIYFFKKKDCHRAIS
jgi:hypothetical protein